MAALLAYLHAGAAAGEAREGGKIGVTVYLEYGHGNRENILFGDLRLPDECP